MLTTHVHTDAETCDEERKSEDFHSFYGSRSQKDWEPQLCLTNSCYFSVHNKEEQQRCDDVPDRQVLADKQEGVVG